MDTRKLNLRKVKWLEENYRIYRNEFKTNFLSLKNDRIRQMIQENNFRSSGQHKLEKKEITEKQRDVV